MKPPNAKCELQNAKRKHQSARRRTRQLSRELKQTRVQQHAKCRMPRVQSSKHVQNVNNTTQGAKVLDAHCASATKLARKNTASAKRKSEGHGVSSTKHKNDSAIQIA
jgi:hypothetical protein